MNTQNSRIAGLIAILILFAWTNTQAQTPEEIAERNKEIMKSLLAMQPDKENLSEDCALFSQTVLTPVSLRLGLGSLNDGPQPDGVDGPQPDGIDGPQPDGTDGPQPDFRHIEGRKIKVDQSLLSSKGAVIKGTRTITVNGHDFKRRFIRTYRLENNEWKITSWVDLAL